MKFFTENWEAKLGSLLASIMIYLYLQNTKLLSRNVNIPIEYPKLEERLEYSRENPRTITVRVSGKRELVSYYSQFMKVILVKKDLKPGENEVQIKKIEGVPNGIKVSLKSDKVVVAIEEKIEKIISLEAVFKDKPVENYLVSSFFVKPNKVRILGRKSVLSRTKKLKLTPISLDGKKENFTKKVKIEEIPRGITIIKPPTEISVKVNMMASSTIPGEQTVSGIPINCSGLDEGLEAELAQEEVSIRFFSAKAINSVDVIQGLTATLNCNYLYDRVANKILPNDKPVLLRVKINKSLQLKDVEILKVTPARVRVVFKVKVEKSDESNVPEEPKPEEEIPAETSEESRL